MGPHAGYPLGGCVLLVEELGDHAGNRGAVCSAPSQQCACARIRAEDRTVCLRGVGMGQEGAGAGAPEGEAVVSSAVVR